MIVKWSGHHLLTHVDIEPQPEGLDLTFGYVDDKTFMPMGGVMLEYEKHPRLYEVYDGVSWYPDKLEQFVEELAVESVCIEIDPTPAVHREGAEETPLPHSP